MHSGAACLLFKAYWATWSGHGLDVWKRGRRLQSWCSQLAAELFVWKINVWPVEIGSRGFVASGAGLPTRGFFVTPLSAFQGESTSQVTKLKNTTHIYVGVIEKIYGVECTGDCQDIYWVIFKHIVKVTLLMPILFDYSFTISSFLSLIEVKCVFPHHTRKNLVALTLKRYFFVDMSSIVPLEINLFLFGTKLKHHIVHLVK